MSAFSLFKSACTSKPYVSFDDLAVGDYFIKSFALANTKFGKTIRLDIGEKIVFLPQRFLKQLSEDKIEEKLDEMNKGQYWMIYKGKNTYYKGKQQINQVLLDIESSKEYYESALE